MEKIIFESCQDLSVITYTKEAKSIPAGDDVTSFLVSAEKNHPYQLNTADEVPFVFYDHNAKLFGLGKLTKEETLNEFLLKKMHQIMVQYNLKSDDIVCYFGPSLTFSHVVVDRPTLLRIMDMGYRAAAKRTSGVDFFDVPIMNFLMLRKLGIPAANITIDAHDTYECDQLLYSSLRGDSKKNPTLVELH